MKTFSEEKLLLMKRNTIALFFFLLLISLKCFSQTGTFNATFTPADGSGKTLSISFTKPVFKFDNPHGYWFENPHNQDRYFNIQPDAGYGDNAATVANGIAFITIRNKEDDFDFYSLTHDSSSVSLQKNDLIISAPEYDPKLKGSNKPMHIHINSISASEISFTISGAAMLESNKGNGGKLGLGTISATAHFYREAKYDKSDVMPDCDCDPTIYAKVFDAEEDLRTTSACEMALNNKVFDVVQKAMALLFTNVAYKGSVTMQAGDISITMIAGHRNIDVPVKERPYCSSDYWHNALTSISAHKKIFTDEDSYGLRFIKMPDQNILSKPSELTALDEQLKNKQITTQQYLQALKDYADKQKNSGTGMDIKKEEVNHNLYLTVIINPPVNTQLNKNKITIQHNIHEAAFETFSSMSKDADGDWAPNRLNIYLGNFDSKNISPIYPANGNKLTVYSVLIKMEGGKDLINKAVANIDFAALTSLISKQSFILFSDNH